MEVSKTEEFMLLPLKQVEVMLFLSPAMSSGAFFKESSDIFSVENKQLVSLFVS